VLTERRANLLRSVVGEYIDFATPVASEAVVRKHGLGVSSATIRNDMSFLEDEGYITRPYSSAGAVPSNKAYRFYVESLPGVEELPKDQQYTLWYQFSKGENDIEDWSRLAASVLSNLVGNVALVTNPKVANTKLVRLELIYIKDFLAFLVIVFQEARLKKKLIPMNDALSNEDLQMVSNKLSHNLGGLSRNEIENKTTARDPFERDVVDMVVNLMAQEDQELYNDHYVEGLRNLLRQPEFANGEGARGLIDVIEDRELPKAILAEALDGGALNVVIGEENREEFLYPFSMVVSKYGLPGGAVGYISALGPTRMEYPRTMAGVKLVSSVMTSLLSRVNS
jgi:heat-inducible transcriptional repressor